MTLLLLALPVGAATLSVDASGSGAYTAIQDAVDAAVSGDTITVASGTYTECVDLGGRDLDIQGAGADLVTIDGAGACAYTVTAAAGEDLILSGVELVNTAYAGLQIVGGDAIVDQVEIRGCGTYGTPYDVYGGAIHVDGGELLVSDSVMDANEGYHGAHVFVTGAATVSLVDSTLQDGFTYYGGIYLDGDAVTLDLDGVTFSGNDSYQGGSAIYASGADVITSQDSIYTANVISYSSVGAGVRLEAGASFESTGDWFDGNGVTFSGNFGGAVYADGADVSLDSGTFTDNLAGYGPGVYATGGSSVAVADSVFTGNVDYNGGTIYGIGSSILEVDGCSFEANTSTGGAGGVAAADYATLSVTSSSFIDNLGGNGAGIDADGADSVVISDLIFEGNEATGGGGAVRLDTVGSAVTISDCSFDDNLAGYAGGAIYATDNDLTVSGCSFDGHASGRDGGAVYFVRGNLDVSDSSFIDSDAVEEGGTIYAWLSDSDLDVTISDTTIEGGSGLEGGGLWVYIGGAVTVSNTRFVDNYATDFGGGIYLYDCDEVTVSHSWFVGNSSYRGGGVANRFPGNGTSWTNNAFIDNSASYCGGGLYEYTTYSSEVVNNVFLSNSAEYGGGWYGYRVTGELTNNVFAYTDRGGGACAGDSSTTASGMVATYNDWSLIVGPPPAASVDTGRRHGSIGR